MTRLRRLIAYAAPWAEDVAGALALMWLVLAGFVLAGLMSAGVMQP